MSRRPSPIRLGHGRRKRCGLLGQGAVDLTDELLLSPDLQETVIEFCRTRFRQIADSGLFDLEPAPVAEGDEDEEGA